MIKTLTFLQFSTDFVVGSRSLDPESARPAQ